MVKFNDIAGGLFFLAGGLFFACNGFSLAMREDLALRTYSPIDAVITSSEVKTHTGSSSRSVTYGPAISFNYEIAGHKFSSTRCQVAAVTISDREAVRALVAQYHPGDHCLAYYDPKNPDRAFLLHKHSFFPYLIILASMPFMTIGLLGVVGSVLIQKWNFEDNVNLSQADGARMAKRKRRKFFSYVAAATFWFGVGGSALFYYFSVAEDVLQPLQIIATAIYCLIGFIPINIAWKSR